MVSTLVYFLSRMYFLHHTLNTVLFSFLCESIISNLVLSMIQLHPDSDLYHRYTAILQVYKVICESAAIIIAFGCSVRLVLNAPVLHRK